MNTARPFGALLALTFVLASCASPEERRWAKGFTPKVASLPKPPARSRFEWNKPSVAFYSFATPSPSATPPTIKDLSDHGQAALIEAMTAAGAKPEDIRDALARPLTQKAASTEGVATVEGTYKRTLVATVSRGWNAGVADRLVRTWIEVLPLNFVFEGYTVIATDNQLLNIAQVTDTSSATLQAQLGRTTSDTSATTTAVPPVTDVLTNVLGTSAGLTGNVSRQRVTNATINQQYTKLGADILPTELRILRESERNLDVSGNTLIALTLRVDPRRWRDDLGAPPGQLQESSQRVTKMRLANEAGAMHSPADAILEVTLQNSPPSCPLIADVYLYYEMRKVTENAGTYVEGKQKADYERGVYEKTRVELVPAEAVRRPSWRIYAGPQDITLKDVFGRNLPLDFINYEQARNFAEWLNQNRAAISGSGLKIGKAGLRLFSGDSQLPFPTGPFEARLYEQKTEKDICPWIEHKPEPAALR
jgi:hypothetical protein